MLISGALTRCFTRTGLPCLLAAYIPTDGTRAAEETKGREILRAVALSRIELPLVRPVGTGGIVLIGGDSMLRVRACDAVTRLFPSSAGFRCVFSPTARYLAVATDAGWISVWDLLACRTLPSLEMAGLVDCAFAPAIVEGRAAPRLLLAGSTGLGIATFREAGPAERIHGIEGQWDLEFKPSEVPFGGLLVHAFSGQVALLARERDLLSLWDLATLCGPQVRTLNGREGSEAGPRCVHITSLRNPLVACRFSPDGRQVALLRACGQLTLHSTDRPGLLEELEARPAPHLVDAPLALSCDGRRMVTADHQELLLWERMSLHDPFGLLRTIALPEQALRTGSALELTHRGDPVILSRAGTVCWYDWERAIMRAEQPLASSAQMVPYAPACGRFPGGGR